MNPVWFILSIILLPLTTVQAVTYKKPGDTVVLSPGSVGATITSITWKYDSNLAAEWYGGDAIDFYRDFKGRCQLNTGTGELIIPKLTLKDSGSYTPEINNRVLATTEIKIIYDVPKPTISMSCDDKKTHCVLTCKGNTTDSGPVTYTWWSGDVVKSKTKEFKITKKNKEASFVCTVKNPVNSESSKAVANPLTTNDEKEKVDNASPTDDTLFWIRAILVALFLVVGVGVIVFYTHKGNKVCASVQDVRWS
ncbi:CD48 antigen-like isoform X3 [Mugil cephalus]|uniref:CD48 antigen-like isoform X3 n=1 Tax=Mugil cephalus TaxID=48193 RepID=UPI001FB5D4D2|nr:CD48 antigen-like isoform X3 [Mugil cephalus]